MLRRDPLGSKHQPVHIEDDQRTDTSQLHLLTDIDLAHARWEYITHYGWIGRFRQATTGDQMLQWV
jgi:hypothetical protein